MWKRILLFAVLNFGALALGSLMMGDPSTNEWYQQQQKAPWTPPGWVFGAAWFTVMAFFTLFMAAVTDERRARKKWTVLFVLQFLLNVCWNPIFFRHHYVLAGLLMLLALFAVLVVMAAEARKQRKGFVLLLPYLIWMCVAISLNAAILVMN